MNDAASRAGSGTVPPLWRKPHDAQEDGLETGEPLEEEPAPGQKKIRARVVPFTGHAARTNRAEAESSSQRTEASGPTSGQMVLATAKYMPAQPPESQSRSGTNRGRRAAEPEVPASSLEGKVFQSGKWGGLLAMAVAVVWFMAGLANATIFFYPPVLFVLGLAAFLKDTLRGA